MLTYKWLRLSVSSVALSDMMTCGGATYVFYCSVWLSFHHIERSAKAVFELSIRARTQLYAVLSATHSFDMGSMCTKDTKVEVMFVYISVDIGCRQRQMRQEKKLGKEAWK